MGVVVEEATREVEVTGSNPTGRVARDFTRKNTWLATSTETGGRDSLWLKSFFPIFYKPVCSVYTPSESFHQKMYRREWKRLFAPCLRAKSVRRADWPVKRKKSPSEYTPPPSSRQQHAEKHPRCSHVTPSAPAAAVSSDTKPRRLPRQALPSLPPTSSLAAVAYNASIRDRPPTQRHRLSPFAGTLTTPATPAALIPSPTTTCYLCCSQICHPSPQQHHEPSHIRRDLPPTPQLSTDDTCFANPQIRHHTRIWWRPCSIPGRAKVYCRLRCHLWPISSPIDCSLKIECSLKIVAGKQLTSIPIYFGFRKDKKKVTKGQKDSRFRLFLLPILHSVQITHVPTSPL